jgi:ketosteroid isomerase-like protein
MRTRVVSIITLPLRLLRRLLGLLASPFRKLGRRKSKPVAPQQAAQPETPAKRGRRLPNPFKRLTGLKGKPRIAVIVILGAAVIVAVLALRPGPNAEKEVRATLDRYATATREKDYQTLCDSLFAKNIVGSLQNAGLPCEVALRNSTFETLRNPTLTVLGIEVTGDQALASTRSTATGELPAVVTIKLAKQGGKWRIASLAEPGTQAPSDTP